MARGRGVVATQQAFGVGSAARRVGLGAVDHVPPVDGEFDAADALRRRGPGLGELAGDAADPDDRRVRHHLQRAGQDVEQAGLLRDVAGGALGGVLRAVAGPHHMGGPGRHVRQQRAQAAHVFGLDERCLLRQLLAHRRQ